MNNKKINELKNYLIKRQYVEALTCLKYFIRKDPKNYLWHALAAEAYANTGKLNDAISHAENSLKLNQNQETIELGIIQWSANLEGNYANQIEKLNAWGDKYYPTLSPPIQVKPKNNEEKIKVAYISGDLKNHSVRYFIEPYFKLHDRNLFEVIALMTMDEDEVSMHLKKQVDQWHNVKNLNDEALHALIKHLEVDILVDLSGHTKGNRLRVFSMRSAPIQMTWFGDMGPLGIEAIDYRITDWGMCPEGSEIRYREKLIRLETMNCYMPLENCEHQYASPYKKNGHVTMISLNHSRKITDQTLSVWCDILHQNTNCGLIVISSDERLPNGEFLISQRLKALQAPMEKIAVMPRLPMLDFMHLAYAADFALDPFPVSGGTTTMHAQWMGLPILSLQMNTEDAVASSSSQTLLGLGLTECVTYSLEGYKEKAGHWINNPDQIDHLRGLTRSKLQASPLMNHPVRVKELEQAYLSLFKN